MQRLLQAVTIILIVADCTLAQCGGHTGLRPCGEAPPLPPQRRARRAALVASTENNGAAAAAPTDNRLTVTVTQPVADNVARDITQNSINTGSAAPSTAQTAYDHYINNVPAAGPPLSPYTNAAAANNGVFPKHFVEQYAQLLPMMPVGLNQQQLNDQQQSKNAITSPIGSSSPQTAQPSSASIATLTTLPDYSAAASVFGTYSDTTATSTVGPTEVIRTENETHALVKPAPQTRSYFSTQSLPQSSPELLESQSQQQARLFATYTPQQQHSVQNIGSEPFPLSANNAESQQHDPLLLLQQRIFLPPTPSTQQYPLPLQSPITIPQQPQQTVLVPASPAPVLAATVPPVDIVPLTYYDAIGQQPQVQQHQIQILQPPENYVNDFPLQLLGGTATFSMNPPPPTLLQYFPQHNAVVNNQQPQQPTILYSPNQQNFFPSPPPSTVQNVPSIQHQQIQAVPIAPAPPPPVTTHITVDIDTLQQQQSLAGKSAQQPDLTNNSTVNNPKQQQQPLAARTTNVNNLRTPIDERFIIPPSYLTGPQQQNIQQTTTQQQANTGALTTGQSPNLQQPSTPHQQVQVDVPASHTTITVETGSPTSGTGTVGPAVRELQQQVASQPASVQPQQQIVDFPQVQISPLNFGTTVQQLPMYQIPNTPGSYFINDAGTLPGTLPQQTFYYPPAISNANNVYATTDLGNGFFQFPPPPPQSQQPQPTAPPGLNYEEGRLVPDMSRVEVQYRQPPVSSKQDMSMAATVNSAAIEQRNVALSGITTGGAQTAVMNTSLVPQFYHVEIPHASAPAATNNVASSPTTNSPVSNSQQQQQQLPSILPTINNIQQLQARQSTEVGDDAMPRSQNTNWPAPVFYQRQASGVDNFPLTEQSAPVLQTAITQQQPPQPAYAPYYSIANDGGEQRTVMTPDAAQAYETHVMPPSANWQASPAVTVVSVEPNNVQQQRNSNFVTSQPEQPSPHEQKLYAQIKISDASVLPNTSSSSHAIPMQFRSNSNTNEGRYFGTYMRGSVAQPATPRRAPQPSAFIVKPRTAHTNLSIAEQAFAVLPPSTVYPKPLPATEILNNMPTPTAAAVVQTLPQFRSGGAGVASAANAFDTSTFQANERQRVQQYFYRLPQQPPTSSSAIVFVTSAVSNKPEQFPYYNQPTASPPSMLTGGSFSDRQNRLPSPPPVIINIYEANVEPNRTLPNLVQSSASTIQQQVDPTVATMTQILRENDAAAAAATLNQRQQEKLRKTQQTKYETNSQTQRRLQSADAAVSENVDSLSASGKPLLEKRINLPVQTISKSATPFEINLQKMRKQVEAMKKAGMAATSTPPPAVPDVIIKLDLPGNNNAASTSPTASSNNNANISIDINYQPHNSVALTTPTPSHNRQQSTTIQTNNVISARRAAVPPILAPPSSFQYYYVQPVLTSSQQNLLDNSYYSYYTNPYYYPYYPSNSTSPGQVFHSFQPPTVFSPASSRTASLMIPPTSSAVSPQTTPLFVAEQQQQIETIISPPATEENNTSASLIIITTPHASNLTNVAGVSNASEQINPRSSRKVAIINNEGSIINPSIARSQTLLIRDFDHPSSILNPSNVVHSFPGPSIYQGPSAYGGYPSRYAPGYPNFYNPTWLLDNGKHRTVQSISPDVQVAGFYDPSYPIYLPRFSRRINNGQPNPLPDNIYRSTTAYDRRSAPTLPTYYTLHPQYYSTYPLNEQIPPFLPPYAYQQQSPRILDDSYSPYKLTSSYGPPLSAIDYGAPPPPPLPYGGGGYGPPSYEPPSYGPPPPPPPPPHIPYGKVTPYIPAVATHPHQSPYGGPTTPYNTPPGIADSYSPPIETYNTIPVIPITNNVYGPPPPPPPAYGDPYGYQPPQSEPPYYYDGGNAGPPLPPTYLGNTYDSYAPPPPPPAYGDPYGLPPPPPPPPAYGGGPPAVVPGYDQPIGYDYGYTNPTYGAAPYDSYAPPVYGNSAAYDPYASTAKYARTSAAEADPNTGGSAVSNLEAAPPNLTVKVSIPATADSASVAPISSNSGSVNNSYRDHPQGTVTFAENNNRPQQQGATSSNNFKKASYSTSASNDKQKTSAFKFSTSASTTIGNTYGSSHSIKNYNPPINRHKQNSSLQLQADAAASEQIPSRTPSSSSQNHVNSFSRQQQPMLYDSNSAAVQGSAY